MSTTSFALKAVIGLLITAVIGVGGYFGTRLAQGAFDEEYRIWVTLGETGQGIVHGSDVVLRGVIVGEVGQIRLDPDLSAEIELVLEPGLQVPTDAMIAVTGKTLLGEKQIEIRPDGPLAEGPFIADGGRIDDPDQVVELQDVLSDLDALVGAIDPTDLAVLVDDGLGAFVGQEAVIARAVDQGARATGVFSRSLDDQVPVVRDLSLVAEALGPRGDEFNRLGTVIDGGALQTVTANQARLRGLLVSLDAFSDQLDVVLELTRPDLDRMIVQGDNVTRMLWTYRPEVADLLVGLRDYARIYAQPLTDPGWNGTAAGFQIMIEEPVTHELCANLPPELAPQVPLCAGEEGGQSPSGPQPPSLPDLPLPDLPLPDAPLPDAPLPDAAPPDPPLPDLEILEVPAEVDATPEQPAARGLEAIVEGLLGR